MAWTYILRCADDSYYTGSCLELDLRMWQHSTGLGAKYTSSRLPVELVFAAEFELVADAYAFEKKVQGWCRAKKEALIAHNFDQLPALSRKDFSKRGKSDSKARASIRGFAATQRAGELSFAE